MPGLASPTYMPSEAFWKQIVKCPASFKRTWLRNLKCGHPKAWFIFSDYFPLFDQLSTSKGYEYKQKSFNAFVLNTPCTKLQHFFSWLWNDISKTCWCYRWCKHGHWGRAAWSDGTLPSISAGTIPHTFTSTLYCITWKYKTNSETKPKLSTPEQGTALQTSQHSVSGVSAESPRCTKCLVASFCHVDVGNCISAPEVCFQHYWSCNLVLWPGTCLSTVFLSLTMSKVAKESYCHELREKSCFMATPVH